MQVYQPSLVTREDTLLGVCEALGEDFGFNPLYLRILFGVGLLWNPAAMVGAYLALGVVVALSRWLVPNPRPAAASTSAEASASEAGVPAPEAEMEEADPLPVAA